ncbi:MAG: SusD/RagB family nutrient-binding outer membrane lipoprotein [Gemmatimonadaceae bacterium]
MINSRTLTALVALSGTLVVAGCHGDFLSGGDLSNNPNIPSVASNQNLMVPIEENLWAYWSGDPSRVSEIYSQQLAGLARQYGALGGSYSQDPTTTNGSHSGLYTAGGLIDIQRLEKQATAQHDSLMLGIAQVTEGALMGTGADLFGNLVYSQALKGTLNPTLDTQQQVYDSVQKVLSAAIANLTQLHPGGVNAGPGASDLSYGGSATKWAALAHTLKARFYMHTATVANPNAATAYANALAQAKLGIMSNSGNYTAAFTTAPGEQNLYYQFYNTTGRGGDIGAGPFLDSLMLAQGDTARAENYFSHSVDPTTGAFSLIDISDARLAPDYQQPLVTYDENTLIWAEAAYRTGDQATALAKLNEERANNSETPLSGISGMALLNAILTEEYISDFQMGVEAYTLYRRTCTPNLVPATTAKKIPGRLFYDTGEQQTNTNIPAAGSGINGYYNPLTPPLTTSDGTGQRCLGQAG